MMKQNILLKFKGAISQKIIVAQVEEIEEKLSQKGVSPKIIKKIFAIFIELAQNVYHHSGEKVSLPESREKVGKGSVIIKEITDSYSIITKNLIENNKVSSLAKHCDHINRLDREELKKFYKEQLKMPLSPDKSGAGVGLIEVARKSQSLLQYKFNRVNDTYSYFSLLVKVKKE